MKPGLDNRKKGFTLIELLIVIALIGLLSTLIVIAIGDSRIKSFDTRRLTDINGIQKALELYSSDGESYPDGNSIALGEINYQCLSVFGFTPVCPVGGERIYLAFVPGNPEEFEQPYLYTLTDNGASYTLEFELKTTIGDVTAGYHVLTPQGIQ